MSVRLSLAATLLLSAGIVACSQSKPVFSAEASGSVVPPSARQKEVQVMGDGLVYSGGTLLEMADVDLGQPVEIEHIENWIIANGKHALWNNALRISLGIATTTSTEAAAQKLEAILSKPGCLVMKDAKGVNLPPYSSVARIKNRVDIVWDAIAISDKSRSPKMLILPWGQIELIDRVDLVVPSTVSRLSACL